MAYIALYRKYRPANLHEVVGQKAVVQTLINALEEGQIHHAYLFCGPRGTGKTSIARAFAKSINCNEGPTPFPCEKCISCQHNKQGNSLDVIEIDAASNRGIDEIRALKEVVSFSPNEGRYKVYIIDEVHMLTKGAFNAFLKTLEEPPPNVIFILATTEPHQVLPTILSRCQRFDFRLLSRKEIVDHLANICEKEGVTAEAGGLEVIAASANGGLRDAISILDQAIAFGKGLIKEKDIYEFLGKVEHKSLEEIVQAAIKGDIQGLLTLLGAAADGGKAPQQLLMDLTGYVRDALVIKECGLDTPLVESTQEVKESILAGMQGISRQILLGVLNILTDMNKEIKFSDHPYLLLELLGVKISNLVKDNYLERLVSLEDRLEKIENRSRAVLQNETVPKKAEVAENLSDKTDILDKNKQQDNVFKDEIAKNDEKAELPRTAMGKDINITFDDLKDGWLEFLNYLSDQRNVRLRALMDKVILNGLKGNTIILGLDHLWRQDALQKQQESLERCLLNYYKKPLTLSFEILKIDSGAKKNQKKSNNDYRDAPPKEILNQNIQDQQIGKEIDIEKQVNKPKKSELKENPLIQEVIRMFNGEIIEE